jgi:integrase
MAKFDMPYGLQRAIDTPSDRHSVSSDQLQRDGMEQFNIPWVITNGHDQVAGWSAARVVVGRVRFEGVHVWSRKGAIDFAEALGAALERTNRARGRSHSAGNTLTVGTQGPTRLLSEEIELYLADMKRRRLSSSSLEGAQHTLALLLAATEDIPVSSIGQDHIRTMWDYIRWWPRNARGQKAYRDLDTRAIVARGRKQNVSAPSVHVFNSHWRILRAFFNRLVEMTVLAESPLKGLNFEVDVSIEPTTGRAFADEELGKIFDQDTFFPWARTLPHRWWVPMLGLYTGARVTELSQLKVADVKQVGSIWTLRIQKTFDDLTEPAGAKGSRQRVKRSSSVRTIPIAQPLLDAGFLDFVADIRATKHPRLFPHLGVGRKQKTGEPRARGYGVMMVDQFSTYTRSLGIEKGVAMHAFRHTISTALRIAKVPDETVAAITGHARREDYPALKRHYQHVGEDVLLREAAEALAMFKPPVALPKYTSGQFKSLLTETWRFKQ